MTFLTMLCRTASWCFTTRGLLTGGALSLAVPWVASWPYSPSSAGWQVVDGIAAASSGAFSAMLWLLAAHTDDKKANAAAAGFSGATAFFGAGAISFSETMLQSQPWLKSLWLPGAYGFGCIVVLSIVAPVWCSNYASKVEHLLESVTKPPGGNP